MDNSTFSSRSVRDADESLHAIVRSIVERAETASRGPVAIVAGHYCIAPDLEDLSAGAEAEEQSFLTGVLLRKYLQAHGIAAPLVLWVNDIGISPAERAALKQSSQLPANYERVWQEHASDAAPSQLHTWFESTMRNNASTWVRRIIKQRPEIFSVLRGDDPSLVRCVNDERCTIDRSETSVYVIDGPHGERLVVKDGPNPKCNLILATLFRTIQERLKATSTICIFNVVYRHRIRLGFHVARTLAGVNMDLQAVFCDGSTIDRDAIELTGPHAPKVEPC